MHSFYHEEALESDAAQTALAVLTLIADNEDRVAFRWWLGNGSPSARKEAYKKVREHCEATGISPWAALSAMEQGSLVIPRTSSLVDRFRELKAIIASVAGGDLAAVIDAVIPKDIEGCDALREAAVLALGQIETIEELVDALKPVVSQPELPSEGDYVRVMSLHKSKGLTSKVAIVAGCVQGLVPFQDNDQPENEREAILKEQRRLFYVAITRCTERLVLSSFMRIQRQIAYKIGARLAWGMSPVGRTIASGFWAELGPHVPVAQASTDWQAAGFT